MTLAELRARWTERRDEWRRLGVQVDGAKLAEEVLADLEKVVNAGADELLTLTAAAHETASTLTRSAAPFATVACLTMDARTRLGCVAVTW